MSDLTVLQVYPSVISNVSQVTQTTVLTQSSGTINLASLSLSDTAPVDVARSASVGVSNVAARADHAHSAADLLVDGGSY